LSTGPTTARVRVRDDERAGAELLPRRLEVLLRRRIFTSFSRKRNVTRLLSVV
jgi:hypothetical protein